MTPTTRKKLEIIIEAPLLGRVEALLGASGARGWSVFASLAGHSSHGDWRSDGLSDAQDKRLVIAVVSEAAAQAALDALAAFFQDYPGVVYVSDVTVLRGEKF
jgi:hypothetical protein